MSEETKKDAVDDLSNEAFDWSRFPESCKDYYAVVCHDISMIHVSKTKILPNFCEIHKEIGISNLIVNGKYYCVKCVFNSLSDNIAEGCYDFALLSYKHDIEQDALDWLEKVDQHKKEG